MIDLERLISRFVSYGTRVHLKRILRGIHYPFWAAVLALLIVVVLLIKHFS